MSWHDRVLVRPSAAELTEALRAARDAVNGRARMRLLPWPPSDEVAFRITVEKRREGQWQWLAPSHGAQAPERSALAVAWWRDVLGRLHLRLYGRRDRLNRAQMDNLFGRRRRPPLSLIYPGR